MTAAGYFRAIQGVRIEHIGERTVNRECDRCGRSLGEARTVTVHCADCVATLKAERTYSPKREKELRAIAAAEGWDFDNPHLDLVPEQEQVAA